MKTGMRQRRQWRIPRGTRTVKRNIVCVFYYYYCVFAWTLAPCINEYRWPWWNQLGSAQAQLISPVDPGGRLRTQRHRAQVHLKAHPQPAFAGCWELIRKLIYPTSQLVVTVLPAIKFVFFCLSCSINFSPTLSSRRHLLKRIPTLCAVPGLFPQQSAGVPVAVGAGWEADGERSKLSFYTAAPQRIY